VDLWYNLIERQIVFCEVKIKNEKENFISINNYNNDNDNIYLFLSKYRVL